LEALTTARRAPRSQDSAIIIVFVTERYITKVNGRGPSGHNDNCKYEYDLALLRKGVERIIPIVMEPRCRSTSQWLGPVGGKLGTKLYIDLSEDGPSFDVGIARLVDEIVKLAGAELPSASADSVASAQTARQPHPPPRRQSTLSTLLLPTKPLAALDEVEVSSLLHSLKLTAMARVARAHTITGGDLACASDADLQHLGLELPMQRRRLLAQLETFARTGVRLELVQPPAPEPAAHEPAAPAPRAGEGPANGSGPPSLATQPSSAALRAMSWAELREELRGSVASVERATRAVRSLAARASDARTGPAARAAAAEAGVLGALVEVMAAHGASAPIQDAACAALIHLVAGADADGAARKQAAADAGALGAIVAAMRAHGATHGGVALAASWALGNLALGTDAAGLARKQAAVGAGALAELVVVLAAACAGELADAAAVSEQALKCVGNLLAGADAADGGAHARQAAAHEAGALGAALSAMREHAAHGGVQRSGCMALHNLTAAAEGAGLARREAAVEAGAADVVVEAMRAHAPAERVQELGALLLASLASGGGARAAERKSALVGAGALDVLAAALDAHAGTVAVLEHALRALGAILSGPPEGGAARDAASVDRVAAAVARVLATAAEGSAVAARAAETQQLLAQLAGSGPELSASQSRRARRAGAQHGA
jgi:hypothetical protein